jgi:hypothetical protein
MVAYNAVWVATPATEEDEQATDPARHGPEVLGRI